MCFSVCEVCVESVFLSAVVVMVMARSLSRRVGELKVAKSMARVG